MPALLVLLNTQSVALEISPEGHEKGTKPCKQQPVVSASLNTAMSHCCRVGNKVDSLLLFEGVNTAGSEQCQKPW